MTPKQRKMEVRIYNEEGGCFESDPVLDFMEENGRLVCDTPQSTDSPVLLII
jgi:hypothetical protein